MCDRGRCEVIEAEAARLRNDPSFEAPWHRIALESAGIAVQRPEPPPPDQPGTRSGLEGEPELPPLWKMALGFAGEAAKHVLAGMPKRSPEEHKRIMAICRSCDHLRADGRCGGKGGCGCGMEAKASWGLTSCPLGKW